MIFSQVVFSFLLNCNKYEVLFLLSSFIPRLIFDVIICQHIIVHGQLNLSYGNVLPYKVSTVMFNYKDRHTCNQFNPFCF